MQTRDHATADATLRRLLDLDPDNAQAHHNIGGVFLETGRKDEALIHYERAQALGYTAAINMLHHLRAESQHEAVARPFTRSPVHPLTRSLFINHHHFGDGLLQLGALRILHERNPGVAFHYTAVRPGVREWLKQIVDRIEWLTWWDGEAAHFDGEKSATQPVGIDLLNPPTHRSIRHAWGSLMGVDEEMVQPFVPLSPCRPVSPSPRHDSPHPSLSPDLAVSPSLPVSLSPRPPFVVMFPHAVSDSRRTPAPVFWERLVVLAIADGFRCYSMGAANVAPITGAESLHGITDVWEAASYLREADCVIVVDNGLKWLTWATGQRRIVELYNDEANHPGWAELGEPWTIRFQEATPERAWERARRVMG